MKLEQLDGPISYEALVDGQAKARRELRELEREWEGRKFDDDARERFAAGCAPTDLGSKVGGLLALGQGPAASGSGSSVRASRRWDEIRVERRISKAAMIERRASRPAALLLTVELVEQLSLELRSARPDARGYP